MPAHRRNSIDEEKDPNRNEMSSKEGKNFQASTMPWSQLAEKHHPKTMLSSKSRSRLVHLLGASVSVHANHFAGMIPADPPHSPTSAPPSTPPSTPPSASPSDTLPPTSVPTATSTMAATLPVACPRKTKVGTTDN